MKRDALDYINDILTECEYLLKSSANIEYCRFIQDENLKRAFVRSLEVIGEATKKIPLEIRGKYQEIPWRDIAGIRDKLIHEYFGVNYAVVWKTIIEDIPEIYKMFRKVLEEINKT
ncbi:MAG: DUF86 domain-containing protein [bacterium]